MGIVGEEGRNHHMRIHQNLANHLSFGEKRNLGSSSIVLRSSTNGLGKNEMKKEGERKFKKKSLSTDILTVIFKISAVMTVMDSHFHRFFKYRDRYDRYIVTNVMV